MKSRVNGFDRVILYDFEFGAEEGDTPQVRCVVFRDMTSGATERVWLNQSSRPCPFDTGPTTLFVAYYATAEASCHLALGWPLPCKMLDLYAEFRSLTNGIDLPAGKGIIGALTYFGIPAMDTENKAEMRKLALRGGPYSPDERSCLMDYCEEDVDALEKLLPKILPLIQSIPQALFRGEYMVRLAQVEAQGIPIDTQTAEQIKIRSQQLKSHLVEALAGESGIYEGNTFKVARFEDWLSFKKINWPRLKNGKPDLKDDTFKAMSASCPEVATLRDLRQTLSQLRLMQLSIGPDSRNRFMQSAFGSRTGRNQPSNSKNIFGASAWLRSLIRPEPGTALCYIDYMQQEVGIAAALSGDSAMKNAYASGDPYLAFAKQAGAVPTNATKLSHPEEREQFKACVLAVQYGMSDRSLAVRIQKPQFEARELLRLHRQTYRVFWDWSECVVREALLRGSISTCFGWRCAVPPGANRRSVANFPMQAHGSEILRVAVIQGLSAGLKICTTVHDAILIESSIGEIESDAEKMQSIMAEASQAVLRGFNLLTDTEFVRFPDRYEDPRGTQVWNLVQAFLEAPAPEPNLSQQCTRGGS